MRSSTSSSRLRFWVFGAVLLLALLTGVAFNLSSDGSASDRAAHSARTFFCRKVRPGRHQVLAYGDSRTYNGIVPEIITNALGRTCLNRAFSSGGINHEMLAFLDSRLAHSAAVPGIVILGVTPLSLTAKSRANEQFHKVTQLYERKGESLFSEETEAGLFRPYPLRQRLDEAVERRSREQGGEWSDLGWRAGPLPAKWQTKHEKTLRSYRSKFRETQVSEVSVTELVDWVGRWSRRGVRVFLFRVPTCRRMVELEDVASGFDERQIRARTIAAGGLWMDVDQCAYESRDASHLSVNGACQMTSNLVQRIAVCLSGKSL